MNKDNKSCENCRNCVEDKEQTSKIVEVYICYYQPVSSGTFLSGFTWGYPSILTPLKNHGKDCVGWRKRKNAREISGT